MAKISEILCKSRPNETENARIIRMAADVFGDIELPSGAVPRQDVTRQPPSEHDWLGEALIQAGDLESHKQSGTYFTPSWLVAKMLDLAEWKSPIGDYNQIVDPACGSGAFLCAALKRLLDNSVASLHDCLSFIRGYELSAKHAKHAKWNLLLEVMAHSEPTYRTALSSSNALDSFDAAVLVQDALLTDNWFAAFPPAEPSGTEMRLIVGNPPYVNLKTRKGEHPYKHLDSGQTDIACLFVDHALNHLEKHEATFSLITTGKLLGAKYASALRERLLSKSTIHHFVDFTRTKKLFTRSDKKSASVYPVVIVASPLLPAYDVTKHRVNAEIVVPSRHPVSPKIIGPNQSISVQFSQSAMLLWEHSIALLPDDIWDAINRYLGSTVSLAEWLSRHDFTQVRCGVASMDILRDNLVERDSVSYELHSDEFRPFLTTSDLVAARKSKRNTRRRILGRHYYSPFLQIIKSEHLDTHSSDSEPPRAYAAVSDRHSADFKEQKIMFGGLCNKLTVDLDLVGAALYRVYYTYSPRSKASPTTRSEYASDPAALLSQLDPHLLRLFLLLQHPVTIHLDAALNRAKTLQGGYFVFNSPRIGALRVIRGLNRLIGSDEAIQETIVFLEERKLSLGLEDRMTQQMGLTDADVRRIIAWNKTTGTLV